MFAKGRDSIVESRLGGSDWNIENGSGFFEREIVLVAEKQDSPAGGRDAIEEGEEGLVGRFAEIGRECGQRLSRSSVERLPAAGALELREGDARGYPEGPRAEDGGLAKERELAEDLERSFLKDVVGEFGAGEPRDVAAQGRMHVAEELLQRGPVAGLGEEHEEGLVGRWRLHRVHA